MTEQETKFVEGLRARAAELEFLSVQGFGVLALTKLEMARLNSIAAKYSVTKSEVIRREV